MIKWLLCDSQLTVISFVPMVTPVEALNGPLTRHYLRQCGGADAFAAVGFALLLRVDAFALRMLL